VLRDSLSDQSAPRKSRLVEGTQSVREQRQKRRRWLMADPLEEFFP